MKVHKQFTHRAALIGALAALAALVAASPAAAQVALTQVSSDPFTNTTSQHATEVEPDTFANGSTVVAAFQVGRFFNGGGSDIGWARSGDGGVTWSHGFLPGITFNSGATGSPYERVSDASVAYDAKHKTWMISSIPLLPSVAVPTVFVSLSKNGSNWDAPVSIPAPNAVAGKVDLDKNWTVCDNHPSSPFYGNCYTEFDNFAENDLEYMSTSSDGGKTWSTPVSTDGNDHGLGGQPLVQPDGTVIVPFETLSTKIAAFRSTDGGASWNAAVPISNAQFHGVGGDLRTSPLPSAEIDSAGKVYVAWEDCRFRHSCSSNDIVFSSSANGTSWSPVMRVPIDSVDSTVDHFIPGLAVDPSTSGSGAHLALTYYFYPDAACDTNTCQLKAGYISSPDGGAHWGAPTTLTDAMSLTDIAQTSQGPMVGDYISTSFAGSTATTLVAVGKAHTGSVFDEAMYAPSTPLSVASATAATRTARSTGVFNHGQGVGEAHHAIRRN